MYTNRSSSVTGAGLSSVIAVAVVGILIVGLAFFVFRYIQAESTDTACKDNLRKIGEAVRDYKLSNRTYPRATGAEFILAVCEGKGSLSHPEFLFCPASNDNTEQRVAALTAWKPGNNVPGDPQAVSYAGAVAPEGSISGNLLAADDDEPPSQGIVHGDHFNTVDDKGAVGALMIGSDLPDKPAGSFIGPAGVRPLHTLAN